MIKPYWISKTYRKELFFDAFKNLPSRKGFSFLKDLYTKRISCGSHLLKFETIWEVFHHKEIRNILDIGAYDGTDSIYLSRIFNNSKIFSFEADINNYNRLVKNTAYRNNIHTINKAVSNYTGEIDFFASADLGEEKNNMDASGSILKPTKKNTEIWKNMTFKEPVKLPCVSISEWALKENINNIDFIWMDVQGAELLVLEGAGKLLTGIKGIIAEIWDDSTYYEGCVEFEKLTSFLKKNNFRLSHLWKPGAAGDALFLNNKFI